MSLKKNLNVILILVIFTLLNSQIALPSHGNTAKDTSDVTIHSADGDTEYWALLVPVGVYYKHPDENRPSMLDALEKIRSALLSSGNWDVDHIKVIKAEEATVINIIRGFLWLDRMEDRNDISLIWIATHGFPLKDKYDRGVDLPPRDEADGSDEALVTYYGFENQYAIIWDDLLNFLLNRLESKGVCLIVDSCYSGGFNDKPLKNSVEGNSKDETSAFSMAFSEDLIGQNRVVLMSSEEDKTSWGSTFSKYLAEGLLGIGDANGNMDDIVSAEEAFYYSKPIVEKLSNGRQRPTILDLFPGELPLTYYQ